MKKDKIILKENEFGFICRRLRAEKKISQEKLAFDCDLATSTLERIENGKVTPKIDSIIKIFSALNCSILILKNDEGEYIKNRKNQI